MPIAYGVVVLRPRSRAGCEQGTVPCSCTLFMLRSGLQGADILPNTPQAACIMLSQMFRDGGWEGADVLLG